MIDGWLASTQTTDPASQLVESNVDLPAALHLPAINGDFDGDEDVDDGDRMIWEGNYGTPLVASKTDGDADGDGDVDGVDFLAWQRTFGAENPVGDFNILAPKADFSMTSPTPDTTPRVVWTAASGAASYDVTITSDAAGTSIMQQHLGVASTDITLNTLAAGDYYTFITAHDGVSHSNEAENNGLAFTVLASFHRMFLTSIPSTISSNTVIPPPSVDNWGGLAAADWVCTFHAVSGGLPGTTGWDFITPIYQAILSDSTENAFDRLNIDAPVYDTANDLIAFDKNDLFDGTVGTNIDRDEFGSKVSEFDVWSGTSDSGLWTGISCGDWNNPSGAVDASVGTTGSSTSGWIDVATTSCDEPGRLYCVSPVINNP